MTAELIDSHITDIEDLVDKAYSIDGEDLSSSVSYITSGSLELSLPEAISSESAEIALQISIASMLHIPVESVDVTVDGTTGSAVYTITSETFDDASNIIRVIQSTLPPSPSLSIVIFQLIRGVILA